jgi:hypothetical protein
MSGTMVNDFEIFDGTPSGDAGKALNNNFTLLANRTGPPHEHAADPDEDDDSADTNGNGVCYKYSLWRNTETGNFWICTDDTAETATWVQINGLYQKDITFILQGNMTLGTSKTNSVPLTRDGIFLKARAIASVAPTDADLIFDINLDAASIWDAGNRLTIVDAATSGVQTVFDTASFTAGQSLTIDVDQIGSTLPGTQVTVVLTVLMSGGI